MADELIDICDDANNLTGVRKMKSEAHRDGTWHRAAHIWIYNSQGEVLLQRRAEGKQLYPGAWDVSVGGHVDAGEEPATAAMRELAEELGLRAVPDELEFFKVVKNSPPFPGFKNNEFYYVYFLKFDGSVDDLKLQVEEVQAVAFIAINEIKKQLSLDASRFVPHGAYWLEALDGLGNYKSKIKSRYMIQKLIKQHDELKRLLGEMKAGAEQPGGYAAVGRLHQAFKDALSEHLAFENKEFYPRLMRAVGASGASAEGVDRISKFIAEMEKIGAAVGGFLKKYENNESIREQWDDYQHDLAESAAILLVRMESEEDGVYMEWEIYGEKE